MYSILKDQTVERKQFFSYVKKRNYWNITNQFTHCAKDSTYRTFIQKLHIWVYTRTASVTVIVPVIKSGTIIMPDTKIATSATVTF